MQAGTAMESTEKATELATGQQDRRTAPRCAVDGQASLLLVQHGSTFPCRVVDLSLNGCRVRTQERFTAGAMVRVEVAFKVRGFAFRFSGVTQWTDGGHLAGIRFVDLPGRRKEELVEALSEAEAENAAKAAKPAGEEQAVAPKQAAAREQVGTPKVVAAAAVVPHKQEQPLQSVVQAPAQAIAAPSADSAHARPSGRERREVSREEIDTSAVIHLIKIASRLQGRILDLSLSGCRVRTEERFPVGIYTRAEVEFLLDGLPFRLGGVIQAIHDQQTVGIRFLDMSSRRREQVEQLIEEIRELKERGTANQETSAP
jgi:c-di-GMP-binding flagellar brake protein YcgR